MSSNPASTKKADSEAKPPHILEAAGRAFKSALNRLSAGDKATLRRADPFMTSGFWRCVQAARNAVKDPDRVSKYERTLAAMVPLMSLKDPKDLGFNLGTSLRSAHLAERRVEMIFTENRLETLIEQIESAATIGELRLDFGVLLRDLVDFQFRPADVRRRWAKSYFDSARTAVT